MAIKINGTTVIDDSRAITGASISVSGTITGAGIDTGSSAISTTGNVTGGNVLSSGIVSATGNVTGNYIIGDGSQLTGLPAGYANSDVATYLSSGTVSTDIKTTAAISATGTVTGSSFSGTTAASTLTGSTLSSNVTGSSLTSVGTIGTGTWAATDVAVAHGGTGASDAATARTNLGLAIGSDVQAYNATLAAVAASNYTGDNAITTVGTIGTGTWAATDVAVAHGGTGASDAGTARTNLGLAIGTDVQAYNATLAAVAGGTYTGDDSITTVGTIGTGTWAATDVAVAHGGTGASDAGTARTNLGLAIGTDVQAYNATLAAVAASTYTGDNAINTVGTITSGTWSATDVAIAHGGTGASNQADARTNLGLGTIATYTAGGSNGAATLDGSGTLTAAQIPASLVGSVVYQGTWNASTNTPTLTSGSGTKGHYYVVSVAGTTDLDGTTDWKIGDWAIYSGTEWQKIDNTDSVTSVAGKTGAVTLVSSDVGLGSVENTAISTYAGTTSTTTVGNITTGTWSATDVAVAHGGTGSSTAAGARTNLGLAIGTDVQAYNATLAAVAASTYTGDNAITTVGTIGTGTWAATDVAVAHGGTGASDAATALTNLGAYPASNPSGYVSSSGVTSVSGTAPVVSSGGATPAISMAAATASVNGYMTSTYASKLDGIAAGAQVNVATNLGVSANGTSLTVTSSTGTNASIPAATTSAWGVMTDEDKTKLDGIASGATNVTNNNQLTNGAGYVTSAGSVASATNATNATNVALANTATAADFYIPFASNNTTGNYGLGVHSSLAYDPDNQALKTTALQVNYVEMSDGSGTSNYVRFGNSSDTKLYYDGTNNTMEMELEAAANSFLITDNGTTRFTFTKATGVLVATSFTGGLTGDVTGTATNATNVQVDDDEATNATRYITFVDNSTAGLKRLNEDSTLNYNPSTGTLAATIFSGTATNARYADLAEKYEADAEYTPGTVVSFGGDAEVTSSTDADTRVAGVVSTNPAYTMNNDLVAEHVVTVAFTGRVPCRVIGTVRKGDLMVSAGNGLARAEANPAPGTIIGKALANHDGAEGVIEVVVGRF